MATEIETGAGVRPAGFPERLADVIGRRAGASAVFGEAVQRDGVTVIPVARVRYGFGGGGGEREPREIGSGGGGAVDARPLGFIHIRGDCAVFQAIDDPAARRRMWIGLLAAAGLAAWMALRGVRALARARE